MQLGDYLGENQKLNLFYFNIILLIHIQDEFWKIVNLCTDYLPKDKPRYLMGVGFPVDLVVCSCLGVDMFDCVFATRTARLKLH